jgi:hypothetical protein
MEATRPKMIRLPETLHTKLVQRAGKQTAKRGERVSVNQVIVEILEAYLEKRTTKRG